MSSTQPTISNRCKVCQLIKVEPSLWREIHDKVLNEKISQAKVCAWANSRLEVINASKDEEEQITLVSPQNFSYHFTHHMSDTIRANLQFSTEARETLEVEAGTHYTSEEKAVADIFIKNWTIELDDYTLIASMVQTLETNIWALDSEIKEEQAKSVQEGYKKRMNIHRLNMFKAHVKDLMELKSQLVKLRNSSKVAGTAVQAAAQFCTSAFIDTMMKASTEALDTFNSARPGETLQVEVIGMLRQRIGEQAKLIAPEVVLRTLKEYKLK